MEMPPDEKLSDSEIADLEQWVKIGAPTLVQTRHALFARRSMSRRRESSGRLRPLTDPAVPKPDRFELADATKSIVLLLPNFKRTQLRPVGDADKRTLIREPPTT